MTTRGFLAALRRRWPVLMVGWIATLYVAFRLFTAPGVYDAEIALHFLAPASAANPNKIQTVSSSLINTAAIVKAEVNDGHYSPVESMPLTVRNVHDGTSVILPNSGSQFVSIFDRPVLIVEATGPDARDVKKRIDERADRIEQALTALQARDHVDKWNLITLERSPLEGMVSYQPGQRIRAAGVTAMLGFGLTCWIAVEVDRLVRRRRTSSRQKA